MGVKLFGIVPKQKITLEDLSGKKIAIDAYNIIYQFLTAIRDRKGKLFKDKKGRVTSHIMGLFYRTANLLEAGVKPCFVFDGKPVALKAGTSASRREIRNAAAKLVKKAREEGDVATAKKYAKQSSKMTQEIVDSSKEFLGLLGIPVVQAPHDGEAQAAWMCQQGIVDAVISQDADCIIYGAPVLVRNLTSGRRSQPEKIVLKDALKSIGIYREKLVEAAILIGTDFNDGVKGIGPKTAIKYAKQDKIDEYKDEVKNFDKIKKLFLEPEFNRDFKLQWKKVNRQATTEFLSEHGFSKKRIKNVMERIAPRQKDLGAFF